MFDLPLDLGGATAFQRRCWLALPEIPYGTTRSYGDQARALGAPRAARAVGAANGRNPLPIVLPCHRLIGANGALTGFGGGLDVKRAQYDALAVAVRETLLAGLAAGGATIDDFRHADGVSGAFQDEFLVHRRRGEGCPNCGGEIVKFVAAGRGTYACERCQPRPRGVRRRAR